MRKTFGAFQPSHGSSSHPTRKYSRFYIMDYSHANRHRRILFVLKLLTTLCVFLYFRSSSRASRSCMEIHCESSTGEKSELIHVCLRIINIPLNPSADTIRLAIPAAFHRTKSSARQAFRLLFPASTRLTSPTCSSST
jgi:hypothetical protein